MPLGRAKFSGGIGSSVPYGKVLPSSLGTAALRGAAQAGVGAQTTGQPNPVKPGQSNKIFGIPMGQSSKKKASATSAGRQNQPVATPKRTKVAMGTGAPVPKAKSKKRPG